MDVREAEGDAAQLYDRAKAHQEDPPAVATLAKRLLGPRAIDVVDSSRLLADAVLFRVQDEYRIGIRRGLPPHRLTFAIAHELAEWFYRGRTDPDLEERCDLLAAAILVPKAAMTTAMNVVGSQSPRLFPRLAKAFVTTQTCAALRYGEVTGTPLALVAPHGVRVRGQLEFNWGPEEAIRAMTRGKLGRGLKKVPLTDDRRRTVILVQDVEAVSA